MGGRHKKKVPVARRLAAYGLCLTATVTLLIAFLSQPVAVSSSAEIPDQLQVDISTSTPTPSPSSSPSVKTKIKKPRRAAQLASPKIEKDQVVTPRASPSIKLPRTSAPRAREDHVRSLTPTAGKVRSSAVQRQEIVIPKTAVVSESKEITRTAKPTPKVAVKTVVKTTVVPRVVLKASANPKPKPQTVVAQPPPVPKLTTNSKCGSIGLLPAPKAACNTILAAFPQVKSVLGVGGRAGNPNSCHPRGLAIDLIVGTDKALGDRLYAFVIARRSALGATPVVLWQVADHFDHVHVSFAPCKG
jgi:hypothetical protein